MLIGRIQYLFHNESLRNGAFFTLFSFINKGINFILLILLARYISPTEYGYWSLFGTIVMFMGYFIAMTTQGYLSVSYFQEGVNGVRKTFSCIISTSLIVATLMALIVFLLPSTLMQCLGFPWRYLYLAIGVTFFTLYTNICLDLFRIQKNIRKYGIFSCGSAILILGLSIFFVKFMLMGWIGCVLAQLTCVSLFGAIGLGIIFHMGGFVLPNINHWKKMLVWGIPLIPHLATNFIQQGCDRYIINHHYNIEQVGLFSFAYSLSAAIMMIGSGFNDANSINIFEILGNKDSTSENKINLLSKQKRTIFLVYLSCSVAITALCYILVPLFLPQYTPAIKYFIILAIYAFLQCIYYLYTNYLFFFKRTKNLMYITFSFAIIHLVIALIFTRYSIYYTCLAYCVTQAGVVLFVRRNAIKAIEENLNYTLRNF